MRIPSLRTLIERIACVAAIPLLAAGIYSAVRLCAADAEYRANTTGSLEKAVQIESDDAEYHALLAEHLEGEGREPKDEREAAVRLSPLESKHWIALAIRAESAGDLSRAEKLYLHAADVDRTYAPRWALMNFYFRRQDSQKFWLWAKRAFEMGYEDQRAAFRFCWLMTDDPLVVERALPRNKEIRRGYLDFLIDTKRFQYLAPLDRQVAEEADATDLPWLIRYCERTAVPNSRSAVDVWNILCRKGLEPFRPLSPEKGEIVTNGDFGIDPIERGFDWRIPIINGVQVAPRADRGMSVQLNGNQPEDCVTLIEIIPLSPGTKYLMSYEYTSDSAAPHSGLSWEVLDPDSNKSIGSSGPLKITGDKISGQATFTAETASEAQLALRYTREPGTVRHEEALTLLGISIKATQ